MVETSKKLPKLEDVDRVAEEIVKNSTDPILDIGFGSGKALLYFMQKGHKVHGLEIKSNENSLKSNLQKQVQREGLEKLCFLTEVDSDQGTIDYLHNNPSKFSLIIMSNLIHSVPRAYCTQLMQGVFIALADEGIVYLCTYSQKSDVYKSIKEDPAKWGRPSKHDIGFFLDEQNIGTLLGKKFELLNYAESELKKFQEDDYNQNPSFREKNINFVQSFNLVARKFNSSN